MINNRKGGIQCEESAPPVILQSCCPKDSPAGVSNEQGRHLDAPNFLYGLKLRVFLPPLTASLSAEHKIVTLIWGVKCGEHRTTPARAQLLTHLELNKPIQGFFFFKIRLLNRYSDQNIWSLFDACTAKHCIADKGSHVNSWWWPETEPWNVLGWKGP